MDIIKTSNHYPQETIDKARIDAESDYKYNKDSIVSMENHNRISSIKYIQGKVPDSWFEFEKKLSDARDVFMEEYDRLCKEYNFEHIRPRITSSYSEPYYLGLNHKVTLFGSAMKIH